MTRDTKKVREHKVLKSNKSYNRSPSQRHQPQPCSHTTNHASPICIKNLDMAHRTQLQFKLNKSKNSKFTNTNQELNFNSIKISKHSHSQWLITKHNSLCLAIPILQKQRTRTQLKPNSQAWKATLNLHWQSSSGTVARMICQKICIKSHRGEPKLKDHHHPWYKTSQSSRVWVIMIIW